MRRILHGIMARMAFFHTRIIDQLYSHSIGMGRRLGGLDTSIGTTVEGINAHQNEVCTNMNSDINSSKLGYLHVNVPASTITLNAISPLPAPPILPTPPRGIRTLQVNNPPP